MDKIFEKRLQVSSFRFQDITIPQMRGIALESVTVKTGDGLEHIIAATRNPKVFRIIFNKTINPGETVNLSIYKKSAEPVLPEKVSSPEIIKAEDKPPEKPGKKPFFRRLQSIQKNRGELNKEIEAIRKKCLNHPILRGAIILTFDFSGCWARALGMQQMARQLQYELKKPLHEYFDIVSGQGDGAIIAAAIAAGIDFDRLADWWLTDWRKVHAPNILKKAQRWAVSKVRPNESGYNARQARKALKKLFSRSKTDLRMKNVLTALQITVMQADMNIHTHYSKKNPDMELWTAVEDSAVTKIHYNQQATIKGEAVFLGAIEKNDVAGLALSADNKDITITSIGTPTRVEPASARKLVKTGHAGDKKALQSAGHFVYLKRTDQLMTKLRNAGYQIGYLRMECKALDGITANATSDLARQAGIDSGSGPTPYLTLTGGENEQNVD